MVPDSSLVFRTGERLCAIYVHDDVGVQKQKVWVGDPSGYRRRYDCHPVPKSIVNMDYSMKL